MSLDAAMKTPLLLGLLLLLGLVVAAVATPAADPKKAEEKQAPRPRVRQKLLVVMLDGCRWDYVEREDKKTLPGFAMLHKEGVRAEYVRPVFPAVSYTNWASLSTGVYAETHNVLGNYYYDNVKREAFELFNATSTGRMHWWQDAEPIWTTATINQRRVATMGWARSDVPFQGRLPEYGRGFFESKGLATFKASLELALRQLDSDFDLIMIYCEHIDNKGHQFGPDSKELRKAVEEVDKLLHEFQLKLKASQHADIVNLMIVADHGMTAGGAGSGVEYVDVEDYIDDDDVQFIFDRGAVVAIVPKPGKTDKVYRRLQRMEGVNVYLRDEIPDEFHYRKSRHVQDILVVAMKGYHIRGGSSAVHIPADPPGHYVWAGFHGYDNSHPDMNCIFMAKGPSFKKHYKGPPIDLVDIYQLYGHVLDVPLKPHNGSWDNVRSYLVNSSGRTHPHGWAAVVALAFWLALVRS